MGLENNLQFYKFCSVQYSKIREIFITFFSQSVSEVGVTNWECWGQL